MYYVSILLQFHIFTTKSKCNQQEYIFAAVMCTMKYSGKKIPYVVFLNVNESGCKQASNELTESHKEREEEVEREREREREEKRESQESLPVWPDP